MFEYTCYELSFDNFNIWLVEKVQNKKNDVIFEKYQQFQMKIILFRSFCCEINLE